MTEIIREPQDLEIITETQELEEKDKLHNIKEGHTHVELVGDIEIVHVECFGTQCEARINFPQERGETVCSLVAGHDEVSPVRPYKVERVHDAKGYMPSLGV